jgi:hypothetical protein
VLGGRPYIMTSANEPPSEGLETRVSIEAILDSEDVFRRCAVHGKWMASNPGAASFAKDWADRNLEELSMAMNPN